MLIDRPAAPRDSLLTMLAAFTLALRQLADPRIAALWLRSVAVSLLAFVVLGAAGWWALGELFAHAGTDRLGIPSGLLALVAALFGGWLLWRVVAMAVLQFYADEVVVAVEQQHYPAKAANARKLGLGEELQRGAGGAFRAVLYNLLALPFALMLLVTGIGPALLFWLVNAVLLGRELNDMVWQRHCTGADHPPLRGWERFMLGGVTAALLAVPVINFFAPFLGAAAAAHLIHRKGTAVS